MQPRGGRRDADGAGASRGRFRAPMLKVPCSSVLPVQRDAARGPRTESKENQQPTEKVAECDVPAAVKKGRPAGQPLATNLVHKEANNSNTGNSQATTTPTKDSLNSAREHGDADFDIQRPRRQAVTPARCVVSQRVPACCKTACCKTGAACLRDHSPPGALLQIRRLGTGDSSRGVPEVRCPSRPRASPG